MLVFPLEATRKSTRKAEPNRADTTLGTATATVTASERQSANTKPGHGTLNRGRAERDTCLHPSVQSASAVDHRRDTGLALDTASGGPPNDARACDSHSHCKESQTARDLH